MKLSSGGDGPTATDDGTVSEESMSFLRALAHVSDRAPVGMDPSAIPARFRVVQHLGSGGFGTVYEVYDSIRAATVALKVLGRQDALSVARFKNEFRSLSNVAHKNLVQLYELHSEGEVWFFTMERVHGEHMLSYVRPSGCDESRLRAVLHQLVAGLRFLHDSGKLHRDIKPSNVMVTADGRVVIVDFGLVHELSGQASERVVGTPAYMAPEQAAGSAVGAPADWYAVGVVLHEALTGLRPEAPADSQALHAAPPDLSRLCLALLRADPAQRPTGREMERQLRSGDGDLFEDRIDEVPFVGRSSHLQQLRDALAAAEGGKDQVVLMCGASGIGKSAIVEQFLSEIRQEDRLVLSGRCFEQESIPYKGVDGLVEDLCRQLRGRSALSIPSILQRLFPAFRDLPAAAPGVPVLVVDDLQWSDLDSTALLASLLGREQAGPMLLVVAYRTEEVEANPVLQSFLSAIQSLSGRVELRRVEVAPLEDAEVQTLSHFFPGEGLGGLEFREAHGDPFLLMELARSGEAERRPGGPSLLAARLDRLPPEARRLLDVVALEGQPVPRAVAVRAAFGADQETAAMAAIHLLRAGHLIRGAPGGEVLLPYHDRIRERVTQMLPLSESRNLHFQLAVALEALVLVEPERLLFHYRSAGRPQEAARYAADAARQAEAALAFDRAARLYREAMALGTPDDVLRLGLAGALAGAGRPLEAARAFQELALLADPEQRLALSRRATELLLAAGYVEEGLTTLVELLRAVGLNLTLSPALSLLGSVGLKLRLAFRGQGFVERAEVEVDQQELLRVDACFVAAAGLFLINPILAVTSQTRHLLLALDSGEPFRIARAFAFEAVFTAFQQSEGAETERLLRSARSLELSLARPYLSGFVRLCEGLVALASGRFRPGHDLVVQSAAFLGQGGGLSGETDLAVLARTDGLWMLGEVAEIKRLTPSLLEAARERGSRFLEMMLRLTMGSALCLVDGRPDDARAEVAEALDRWPRQPGSLLHIREIRAQTRISLYAGQGQDACDRIAVGLAALRKSRLILAPAVSGELRLLGALAALAVGDRAGARSYARSLVGLPFVWAKNAQIVIQAVECRSAGDIAGATSLLDRARETAVAQGAMLHATAMSRRLGEWTEDPVRVAAADVWMAAQGIVEPARMARVPIGMV